MERSPTTKIRQDLKILLTPQRATVIVLKMAPILLEAPMLVKVPMLVAAKILLVIRQ